MSRKHFARLAEMVRKLPVTEPVRLVIARELADLCASMNPRFNRSRWFAACGVEAQ